MLERERFIATSCLAGLAATAAAATGWLRLGPADLRMVVPRAELGAPVDGRLVALGAVSAGVVVVVVALRSRLRWPLVFAAIVAATIGIDLGLHQPLPHSWSWRTIATAHLNPFFAEAGRPQSVSELVTEQRRRLAAGYLSEAGDRRRLTTYPEGLPVLYRAAWWLADRGGGMSRWLARLGAPDRELGEGLELMSSPRIVAAAAAVNLAHLAALLLLPLAAWWLGHTIAGSEAAVLAAAFTALAPAPHLWVHDVNLLTAWVPAAATAGLVVAARRRPPAALAVGLGLAVAVGLTLSILPGAVAAGLVVLLADGSTPRSRRLAALGWCAAGGLAGLGVAAAAGSGTLGSALLAVRNSQQFYVVAGRHFWPTLASNAVELWVLGGGVAMTAAVLAGVAAIRVGARRDAATGGRAIPAAAVIFGLVIVLLATGSARGEIGRNGMCLVPLLAAVAATDRRAGGRSVVLLAAATAVASVLLCVATEPVLGFFMLR